MRFARALLLLLVAVSAHAARYTACGVSFRYPSSWRVTRLAKCSIALDPSDWKRVRARSIYDTEEHAMKIDVYALPMEAAARKGHFYFDDDGQWRILGRGIDYPHSITTACCKGMRGMLLYGRFLKSGEGGYQGLGEYDYAILSNEKTSVIIAGPGEYTRVFDSVLMSVRP